MKFNRNAAYATLIISAMHMYLLWEEFDYNFTDIVAIYPVAVLVLGLHVYFVCPTLAKMIEEKGKFTTHLLAGLLGVGVPLMMLCLVGIASEEGRLYIVFTASSALFAIAFSLISAVTSYKQAKGSEIISK